MYIPSLEIIQQAFLELWIKIGDFSSLHRRKTQANVQGSMDFRSSFLSMSIVSMKPETKTMTWQFKQRLRCINSTPTETRSQRVNLHNIIPNHLRIINDELNTNIKQCLQNIILMNSGIHQHT